MSPTTTLPPLREEALAWNFPLGIDGFFFGDLYHNERLRALDDRFLAGLRQADPALAERLLALRATGGAGVDPLELSNVLVAAGPHLGRFVARLFQIESEAAALDGRARDDEAIFRTRRIVLERRYFKTAPSPEELRLVDVAAAEKTWRQVVARRLGPAAPAGDPERELGLTGARLLDAESEAKAAGDPIAQQGVQADLDALGAWARLLAFHPDHRARTRDWALFFRPEKIDYENLVERRWDDAIPGLFRGFEATRRYRDGFELTDRRMSPRQALGEMHYCVLCHERKKDSCSHGFAEGPVPANKFEAKYRKNPLGIALTGCPLDEKISESNQLKREGESIAALAMVMVDNPLCAGTGHRICNDCMKGCIYQKTTPVNIPQAETNIADRRPGAPLGVRDLLAPDPLEPAEPGPALAAPLQRPERPDRGDGPGRLLADPVSAQRGLRRGRPRRAQDRTAGPADLGVRSPGAAPGAGHRHDHRAARPADDSRLRRRVRVRHHRAVGQEFPRHHLPPADAAAALPPVRRSPLRQHRHHRRRPGTWASTTSPWPPGPAGPPC